MDHSKPPLHPDPNLPPGADVPSVSPWNFWRVLFVSLACVGVVGTIAFWGYERHKDGKLYRTESSDQREVSVKDAFAGGLADLTSPEARSVDHFFKEQGDAQNRKDIQWQLNHYDFVAMLETVRAHADFPDADKVISYLKKNEKVIETAMRGQFAQFLSVLSYSRHRLQRLEFNKAKTLALAYVLETDADGVHARNRVWLKKQDTSWLIYDAENLEMGLRNSLLLGNVLGSKTLPKMNQTLLKFVTLAQHAQSGEVEETQKLIESLKGSVLPSQLKAVVYFMDASLLLGEEKFDEALESAAEVRRLAPESVGVEQLVANIYSAMGKHEEALAAARKFMDFLGLDPEAVVVACKALQEQKNRREASELLTRALKEFPDDNTLLGILPELATPEEMNRAFTNGLSASKDAEALFEILADEYESTDELDALNTLTSAMKEILPESESLKEYQTKASDYLLIKRATADLAEAKADFQRQFEGETGGENLLRLTANLDLPKDQDVYRAICAIFAESQPNKTKELAVANAHLALGLCYCEMDEVDGDAAAFFEAKLANQSNRETYVRTLADAAILSPDTDLLSDLLDALRKVEPNSPVLADYLAKLKTMEAEDDPAEK